MTIRGLTEHIGTDVTHFHLYIAKEDIDNGGDYLENTYMDANDRRIISIWVQTNDVNLTIITRNSNINNRGTIFQTNFGDIVDYDYFTSTKKNKFRISRGAIGDATKPKLSMPYALLYENGAVNGMAAPLIIQYNNQESKVSLDTTKFITNKLEAKIDTKERLVPETYTQVQLTIPRGKLSNDFLWELKEYYLNYSIFSTHIRFNFDFNGEKFVSPNNAIASSTWTNQITAWAYTDNEFYAYIEKLVDQSKTLSSILEGWREFKWLPKDWKQKKLNELSAYRRIALLEELKQHSRPMERLSVSYGGNKECDKQRKDALIKRIAASLCGR